MSGPSDRIVLGLTVVWLAVNVSARWYPTPDSVGYLSVARELADTGRLRNLDSPHIYYPIGYPLIVTPAFMADDEPFLFISLLHFALGVALVWLVYRWAREFFPEHAAWIAFVTVANASFGNVYRRPLGETAFMAAWMLAGLSFNRLLRTGRGTILAALAFIPLVLIRPAGAMLAGGFVAGLALVGWRKERPWRTVGLWALVVIPAAGIQFAWMTRDRLSAEELGKITYSEQLRDPSKSFGEQLVEGFRLRIQEAGRVMIPGMFRAYARAGEWVNVNMLLFLPLTAGLLVGWVAAIRRRRDVPLWALPAYVGLYVLWPYDQSTRFFTPILPMFLVCWLSLVRELPARLLRWGMVAFAVLHLGVAIGYWQFDERRQNGRLMEYLPELRQVVAEVPPAERGLVAISSKCQDQHPVLSFLLNRTVEVWEPLEPVPKSARWLVLHESDTPPAGFAPASPRAPRLYQR